MDGAKIGIFEQSDQVSLSSLLESKHGGSLEAEIGLEVLGDLTNQTLERQLADKKLGALLVAADFTKGNCTWAVSVRLLDSSGGWGTLSSCLRGAFPPVDFLAVCFVRAILRCLLV